MIVPGRCIRLVRRSARGAGAPIIGLYAGPGGAFQAALRPRACTSVMVVSAGPDGWLFVIAPGAGVGWISGRELEDT